MLSDLHTLVLIVLYGPCHKCYKCLSVTRLFSTLYTSSYKNDRGFYSVEFASIKLRV